MADRLRWDHGHSREKSSQIQHVERRVRLQVTSHCVLFVSKIICFDRSRLLFGKSEMSLDQFLNLSHIAT